MARIIGEVQPQYAFVENSPMLTSRGLGTVLGDLSEMGFDAKWCVLGADSIGAPHKRDRIWILATNARGIGRNIWSGHWEERFVLHDINWDASQGQSEWKGWIGGSREISSNVANTRCELRSERYATKLDVKKEIRSPSTIHNQSSGQRQTDMANSCDEGLQRFWESGSVNQSQRQEGQSWTRIIGGSRRWWESEPNVGRVVNGMADRVDRLKAIGNGQVPLCAATAWRILNEL
jgi:DNA (cytosine-5)-methyltransferase 1